MSKEARAYCLRQRKIAAIEWAEKWGNISRACRTFCVSRSGFYRWKKLYEEYGEAGQKLRKPIAKDHPRRIPEAAVQKVLELRRTYHLGLQRIVWYTNRYMTLASPLAASTELSSAMVLTGCRSKSGVVRYTRAAARRVRLTIMYKCMYKWMSKYSA